MFTMKRDFSDILSSYSYSCRRPRNCHDHHEHHDAEHFDQIAKTKKSIPRAPFGNLGLSVTNSGLDSAARNFVDVNNEVGLRLYR